MAGDNVEVLTCAFCKGRGVDPYGVPSEFSACCVCGGRGKVWVAAPHIVCAHCAGSGSIKTFTCSACGGKGAVPAWPGNASVCGICHGTGDDASNAGLACLNCRGSGFVSAGVQPFLATAEPKKPKEIKMAMKSPRGKVRHEYAG